MIKYFSVILFLFSSLTAEIYATNDPVAIEARYSNYRIVDIDYDEQLITLDNGTRWQKLETDYRWDQLELRADLTKWRIGDGIQLQPRENGLARLIFHNKRLGTLMGVELEGLPQHEVPAKLHWLTGYKEGNFWHNIDSLELEDGSQWLLPGDFPTRRDHSREWENGDLIMTEVIQTWHEGPKQKLILFNLSKDPEQDFVVVPLDQEEESSTFWPSFWK